MWAIQQQLPWSGQWMTVAVVGSEIMADVMAADLNDANSIVRSRVQRIDLSELNAALTWWQSLATTPSSPTA
jgi:predicted HAD superfamily phosphohydrolase YqeG